MILQHAINEAEAALQPTKSDSTPVALTNGALQALLDAVKDDKTTPYVKQLEQAVEDALRSLENVVRT